MKLITLVLITLWVQLDQRLCHQSFLSVIFKQYLHISEQHTWT